METIITQLPNRRNYLKGKYTVEIGYPWLSYGAIIALEEILTADKKVLEFGAGGSTVFFSRRCKSVKTFECNHDWVDRVKVAVGNNTEIICSDIEETLMSIEKEKSESYDIILLDNGPDYTCRKRILDVIPRLLAVGGYFVIDNYSQRYLRRFRTPPGWDCYIFDDIRYHGTGTKIYKRIV